MGSNLYPPELLYLLTPIFYLVSTLLILFVVMLTFAKDKVSHPRLCFFGAICLGFAFALPFVAYLGNMLISSWFSNGRGPGEIEQLIALIAGFGTPLLVCLSILFMQEKETVNPFQ